MSEDTPLSLLERIRDGEDATAWREFDAIYRPLLHRYGRAWLLDSDDVEDVVQHCMAAIHANIERFTHDSKVGRFRAWLRTMVDNHIKSLFAKKRPQALDRGAEESPQSREEPPEDAFARIWYQEHLRFYLNEVRSEIKPENYRNFELHVLRQLPADEVCRSCGCTANQLYKIKWRVTQKLRDKMQGLLDDE